MKLFFQALGIALLAIVTLAFLGLVTNSLSFVSFAFWTPKVEQVRYNTFKESQAYNDGMLRDLENLKLEYLKGNTEQRQALKALVIHRFSVYDVNRLPDDLQVFYHNLEQGN